MKGMTSTVVKFSLFAVVMLLVTGGLVVVFGNVRFENASTYRAEFADVSDLRTGQFVRIAGVEVGKVKSVALRPDDLVDVEFSVDTSVTLTESTEALVRYDNLIGDRFLELRQGSGSIVALASDSAIPVERTRPALDLDALIGGFRPLLQALDPEQVNDVSASLVAVFQDQGGTISDILAHTGALTATLADRDALLGSVVSNLNGALGIFSERQDQFDEGVDKLAQLISGLGEQSETIAASLTHIDASTRTVADLLEQTRPDIADDIAQLGRVAGQINQDTDYVDDLLSRLPVIYEKLSRLGLYGDFFTFYLCDVTLKVNGQNGNPQYVDLIGQRAGRCE
ncbi:phospholipid/cholesterol/gamma-HCH transport system substrate-binding protein [Rhodococcus sp. 27YEA15]|uniref:MCE family protein n=1 Tax=Rhodococcus sp. 27YEA15 TaxID=3156259 RepID=UPI003C7C0A3F